MTVRSGCRNDSDVRSGCRNDSDGNDCHDHGTAAIVRAMTDMNMVDWFFDKLLIMTRQ